MRKLSKSTKLTSLDSSFDSYATLTCTKNEKSGKSKNMEDKKRYFLDPTRVKIESIISASKTNSTPLQAGRLDERQHIVLKKVKLETLNPKIFHVKHDKLSIPLGLHVTEQKSTKKSSKHEETQAEIFSGPNTIDLQINNTTPKMIRSKSSMTSRHARRNQLLSKTASGRQTDNSLANQGLGSTPSTASRPKLNRTTTSDKILSKSTKSKNLFSSSQKNSKLVTKLVSKFYKNGCLSDYLSIEPITVLEAVALCSQIVQGMRYLEYNGIIHGRLSCRNVLITSGSYSTNIRSSGSKTTESIKLADFGLGEIDLSYPPFNLPLSHSGYTTKNNDIWAFGMTLFEIFNGGIPPFYSLSTERKLEKLKSNQRPEKPESMPPCIYELALRCLLSNIAQRPFFNQLSIAFDTLYLAMTTPDFHYRDELFGLEDESESDEEIESSTEKPTIDTFKNRSIHSNFDPKTTVNLLKDPKSLSNILTEQQLKQLQELISPGCSKPYPAKTDLVWIDNKKSYALIPSSDFDENSTNSEYGILGFFKQQVGLFDVSNELWNLLINPETNNSEDIIKNHTHKSYLFNCKPVYPCCLDSGSGRVYAVLNKKSGLTVKYLDIYGIEWKDTGEGSELVRKFWEAFEGLLRGF